MEIMKIAHKFFTKVTRISEFAVSMENIWYMILHESPHHMASNEPSWEGCFSSHPVRFIKLPLFGLVASLSHFFLWSKIPNKASNGASCRIQKINARATSFRNQYIKLQSQDIIIVFFFWWRTVL